MTPCDLKGIGPAFGLHGTFEASAISPPAPSMNHARLIEGVQGIKQGIGPIVQSMVVCQGDYVNPSSSSIYVHGRGGDLEGKTLVLLWRAPGAEGEPRFTMKISDSSMT